jgi:hypothetical protein
MQYDQFNEKYHILRTDINPHSLFASFNVFKKITTNGIYKFDQRPPYPILMSNPTYGDALDNMNKSDALVGLTIGLLSLPIGFFVTSQFGTLQHKFYVMKWIARLYVFFGAYMSFTCSAYRLMGYMDNGLRWKHQDLVELKYDFTRDFESKTIWKYLRERND